MNRGIDHRALLLYCPIVPYNYASVSFLLDDISESIMTLLIILGNLSFGLKVTKSALQANFQVFFFFFFSTRTYSPSIYLLNTGEDFVRMR